MFANNT